jgi:hypothetical protein
MVTDKTTHMLKSEASYTVTVTILFAQGAIDTSQWLKSRIRRISQVRFRSGSGAGDRLADHNLDGALFCYFDSLRRVNTALSNAIAISLSAEPMVIDTSAKQILSR